MKYIDGGGVEHRRPSWYRDQRHEETNNQKPNASSSPIWDRNGKVLHAQIGKAERVDVKRLYADNLWERLNRSAWWPVHPPVPVPGGARAEDADEDID